MLNMLNKNKFVAWPGHTITTKICVSFCIFVDLNATADQQYDALLLSNVVPMYPEFKSKFLSKPHSAIGCHKNAMPNQNLISFSLLFLFH